MEEKKSKKVFGELFALIILLLIIGGVSYGGWYWYNNVYKVDNKDNGTSKIKNGEYKAYAYTAKEGHYVEVINDKFVVEFADASKLYKIMDMKTNVLYSGERDYDNVYEGVDGNVYVVDTEVAENEDVIDIFKATDGELKKVTSLAESGVYYSPVIYKNLKNGKELLLGFVGRYGSTDVDDGYKSFVYYITGKTYEIDDATIVGDSAVLSVSEPIYTYSEKYIVVEKTNNKSGLLDFSTGEMKIDYNYDGLYTSFDGNYIAVKDKKAGVIDLDLKKLIDFEYDFVDRSDGFYIVSKDKKLGIIDENFNKISDVTFDYQAGGVGFEYLYKPCCANFNTFEGYKIGDKYVLVTNYNDVADADYSYSKHEAYVVSQDGKVETIKEKNFEYDKGTGLIYSYFDKKVTVYDSKMEKIYDVDLNKYDIKEVNDVSLMNGTLYIDKLMFDYKTGESIKEAVEYEEKYGDLSVKYSKDTITFYEKGKEIQSYDYGLDEFYYSNKVTEIDNGIYYNRFLKGIFVSILK